MDLDGAPPVKNLPVRLRPFSPEPKMQHGIADLELAELDLPAESALRTVCPKASFMELPRRVQEPRAVPQSGGDSASLRDLSAEGLQRGIDLGRLPHVGHNCQVAAGSDPGSQLLECRASFDRRQLAGAFGPLQQALCHILGGLDIRLVKGMDPQNRACCDGGELPPEELTTEVEPVSQAETDNRLTG